MEQSPSPSSADPSSSTPPTSDICKYEIAFRLAEEKDMPYVKDTYAESFKDAPASRHVHGPIYKKGARRTIDVLRERSQIWVVHPPKYPDLLLGWAIVEATPDGTGGDACVHYIYVKKAYRRAGVASSLVASLFDLLMVDPAGDIRFSHWRLPAGKLARKRGWRFDPFVLLEPAHETLPSKL